MWCSFLRKYTLVFEKLLFSFDRSNMQIFTMNITRAVWPFVSNVLDLRYFCKRKILFYYLNLIPCRYWSFQRNIYFLVNIFVRHTFPISKSSIKTKTVLTMTDMTQSTELQAFIRQKDGYKVTLKISLCICVVLSWDELKVWQNLLDSDYEMYIDLLSRFLFSYQFNRTKTLINELLCVFYLLWHDLIWWYLLAE